MPNHTTSAQAEARSWNSPLPTPTPPVRVSQTLTRGANVSTTQFAALRGDGFRSIVSLNLEGDADAEHAAPAGLKAISVPVLDQWCPTLAQAKLFLDEVTRAENQPVYVHCATGGARTGVLVACYRLAVDGWALKQALAEANVTAHSAGSTGLTPEQHAFIVDFHRRLTAGEIDGY